jgi:hypothetical protein
MPAKAQLKDIIDALEMQFDECSSFFDRDTGQVETVSGDLLNQAEDSSDGAEPDDLLEWQEQEWEVAKRIVSAEDRFERLPTKFDVHEWSIMEDYSLSLEPGRLRDDLLFAIHGRGAFRHFKDTLRRHGVEETWFAFHTEALKQIAIDWCEEHQIAWE